MSADVKIILADLDSMASTFHEEAGIYRGMHANVKPAVAGSGDAGCDAAVKSMADLIAGLHDKLSDRLEDNSDKVKYAHDSMQRNDIDVHGLFEDLM
ncbi:MULTISPECIES: DUF6317 family protein [unclassified Streptomyces]|uniref:DUF6317 family protein n=1 Tax=Streptomyces sp. NBC_00060 TaxID=2975636 RepID=A0AAU2GVY9_9ACTN